MRWRQSIRSAAREKTRGAVVRCIDGLRRDANPTEFKGLVAALRAYAPMQSSLLFSTGAPRFELLVWARPPFEQMTLEREIKWATCWLEGQSQKISRFRVEAQEVQRLLINGEGASAIERLDAFSAFSGWSMWYVELRCALEQLINGNEAQKAWSTRLQNAASNRVSGLLAHIFSERNDESFSYDSFYSKCRDSFPRFKTSSNWLPRYLLYRAIGHVDDPEKGLPTILAREATSSLIDYYESLIDVFRIVVDDKDLSHVRPLVREAIARLLSDGYDDHRLLKLGVALGAEPDESLLNVRALDPKSLEIGNLIVGRPSAGASISGVLEKVPDLLAECTRDGVIAGSSISSLLKLGLNLRSLDVGQGVGMASQHGMSDFLSTRACSIEAATFLPLICPEDAAAFPDAAARSLVESLAEKHPEEMARRTCKALTGIIKGGALSVDWAPIGVLHLWLGRQLIVLGRFEEAYQLGLALEGVSDYWRRQGAKLKLWSLIRGKQTQKAVDLAATWILDNPRYTVELPVSAIFEERDWASFKDISPEMIGLVAHHAHVSSGDPKIAYICKMACRRFAVSGDRDAVAFNYESSIDSAWKRLVIAFLRDVWIEENLSMNHLLDSIEAVSDDRMNVCQLLLTWDPSSEVEYIEEIKNLTLDQTLRKGLKHIDQNRIFVNEPAITRWAEKELSQDFERWQATNESSPSARIDDEFVRQYIVDPQNEEFLRELSGGDPTEADVLLANIFERLYRRFLTDPADGLDCFLSLRIRHGSLRGTLFGPLEEQGLFYTASGFSKTAFDERWSDVMRLTEADRRAVVGLMEQLASRLRAIADELVNERVQIRSAEKPLGAIAQYVVPVSGKILNASLKGQAINFSTFSYMAYFLFWEYVKIGLSDLADYVRNTAKDRVRQEFDSCLESLRLLGSKTSPLVAALTAVSTETRTQCDAIADWFQVPIPSEEDQYKLSAAIEIARTSTKRVHRAFPAEIKISCKPGEDPPLATGALFALSDSLFVIFENAWKYSGLGVDIGSLDVIAELDREHGLLTLRVENDLSLDVLERLGSGHLDELRERHLSTAAVERTSREGGSGFAKLSRMSRYVDRALCPTPLDFGVDSKRWFTIVTIPLYERNGVYETY